MVAKTGFARSRRLPKEPPQPHAQPWPFFFLATFLAAFFFFFAIVMAPCHEHPHASHGHSPGCSRGGEKPTFRFVTRASAHRVTAVRCGVS